MVEVIPQPLSPELLDGHEPLMVRLLMSVIPAVVKLYSSSLLDAPAIIDFPIPTLVAIHPMVLRDLESSWTFCNFKKPFATMWASWEEDVFVRGKLCEKVARLDDRDPKQAKTKKQAIEFIHSMDLNTADITVRTIAVFVLWRMILSVPSRLPNIFSTDHEWRLGTALNNSAHRENPLLFLSFRSLTKPRKISSGVRILLSVSRDSSR